MQDRLPNFGGPQGPQGPRRQFDIQTIIMIAMVAVIVIGVSRINTLNSNTIIYLLVLVPSVVLHEISHGWLAHRFGDNTAKLAGRLTLNPVKHIDPVGTIILPGVLLLSGSGLAFGYAKPVPVNVSHMSRNKAMFVGLIGPITNIVLSAIVLVLIHVVYRNQTAFDLTTLDWTFRTLLIMGHVNVVLAVFNLIPIPPLDGSSIIERFLPDRYVYQYLQFRKYAMIMLLVLVLAWNRALGFIFDPAIEFWDSLLP
jgi:Zn-dependent protease